MQLHRQLCTCNQVWTPDVTQMRCKCGFTFLRTCFLKQPWFHIWDIVCEIALGFPLALNVMFRRQHSLYNAPNASQPLMAWVSRAYLCLSVSTAYQPVMLAGQVHQCSSIPAHLTKLCKIDWISAAHCLDAGKDNRTQFGCVSCA